MNSFIPLSVSHKLFCPTVLCMQDNQLKYNAFWMTLGWAGQEIINKLNPQTWHYDLTVTQYATDVQPKIFLFSPSTTQ